MEPGGAAAFSVNACKIWEVTTNRGHDTWRTHSVEVDGKSYINFSRYDRDFFKLVCGKAMGPHKKGLMKKFGQNLFQQLRQALQVACNNALADILRPSDQDNAINKKRRNKTIKAKRSHAGILPAAVTVHLDGFEDADGQVAPFEFSMLTKEFWSLRNYWIEIEEDKTEALKNLIRSIRRELTTAAPAAARSEDEEECGDDKSTVSQKSSSEHEHDDE